MGRKSSSKGSLALGAVVIVVGAIASMPKEVWFVLAAVAFAYFVLKMLSSLKSKDVASSEPVSVPTATNAPVTAFRIPGPPAAVPADARWIAPAETITFRYPNVDYTLADGMVYVGSGLDSSPSSTEPALINPRLPISTHPADESLRLTDYWPSYSTISPEARRAYLQWHAGGRCNPQANIGYVFLFFYGLERRALIDAKHDPGAKVELPAIMAEVRRLLGVYGYSSGSFHSYATNFLDYLQLAAQGTSPVYLEDPPTGRNNYELPLMMRLGLGQMALNKIPVSAKWAHAWALAEPNISRRTPVTRCSDVFETLFEQKYRERFGDGMVLPVNRTQLRPGYRPASAGLAGKDITIDLGGIPDISATAVPTGRLRQLVDECANELDGYSRFIGRNPDKKDSLEALLQLPPTLWPAEARAELDDLKTRIGDGLVVMTFGELSGRMKSAGALTRDKVLGFARALESMHLGMEPDVLGGAKTPKGEDSIVLFATHPEDGDVRSSPAYQAAAVTIGLSYAVAAADGDVSPAELTHLSRQADAWLHLSSANRKRLKAHLRLQMAQPTPLATFKKKLEPLAQDARRAISRFLAHLAQVDGAVSPAEVKLLEKLYKTLGVDSQLLYGDIHGGAAPSVAGATPPLPATSATGAQATGFTLDPARIAALQRETEQVSTLLAGVFADAEAEPLPPKDEDDAVQAPGLIGLDAGHSAFLRLLFSRPSWPKQDLADAAADMELMLEGALERINEAFFDHFDEALTDGDDPVEINQSLLEKMPA